MLKYDFLILSLLFLVPGAVIYALRQDLRPVIRVMMLCSIPFAFTEFLFYPDYWEPVFLFDLAARIGFGIEDVVFVCGLGAFTSTGFLFFSGFRLAEGTRQSTPGEVGRRLGVVEEERVRAFEDREPLLERRGRPRRLGLACRDERGSDVRRRRLRQLDEQLAGADLGELPGAAIAARHALDLALEYLVAQGRGSLQCHGLQFLPSTRSAPRSPIMIAGALV